MSADAIAELTGADREYAEIWCKSTVGVLESLQAAPFTGTCEPSASATEQPASDTVLALLFKVSGSIAGDQCFRIAKSDAVRLAQLLMSEPMDASVPYADAHTDALHEIFRQFAGLAATACKSKYGGEVQFQLEGPAPSDWQGGGSMVATFAAPKVSPIQWTICFGSELHALLAVLEAAREAKAASPPVEAAAPADAHVPPSIVMTADTGAPGIAASGTVTSGAPTSAPPRTPPRTTSVSAPAVPPAMPADVPANLDLLLDIELDASLRFGRREMILRDILNLRPGSVVELDRQIQEPAELLIAGRVVARGEVVIVDGSYGLRITEIEQPQHRLISVQT